MASDINPSLTPTKSLVNFRFWCQKVLPLVYDDSLSYYEVLGKMVAQLNDVIDDVNADTENVLTLKDAFLALQTYVNEFFDDIDQLASYAERAEDAQTAANQSAINAASSASNASASSIAAMNARDAAVSAKEAAEASASTASTAATNANTKASEAAQSAITAQTAQASASQSATLAATDRSAAQTAASTATTKANEASTSASNAETSAENASQSEANAEELVNNIQENLDNIQHNTQDISDLKESTNELKTALNRSLRQNFTLTNKYTHGYLIPVGSINVGSVVDPTPTANGGFECIVVPCNVGDTFTIAAKSGVSGRLWAFTDTNYVLLSKSAENANTRDNPVTLTAEKAGYFISSWEWNGAKSLTASLLQNLENFAKDFNVSVDTLTDNVTEAINELGIDIYNPTIANGSVTNPANANAVNTSDYIPVSLGDTVRCNVFRPLSADGNYYSYIYVVYNSGKSAISSHTDDSVDNQIAPIVLSTSAYIRFAVVERVNASTFRALRTTDFVDSNHITITVDHTTKNADIVEMNKTKKEEAYILNLKKTSNENYSACDAKFLFMTDIHKEENRLARAVQLSNAWGTDYISAVINGGDTVATIATESLTWYYDKVDTLSMPVLNTVGNHDAYSSLGTLDPDPKNAYNLIIAPIVTDSGIIQPQDASTYGYNYYYKDFNAVRVIVLDCMYWDSTQLTWFESVLADALTNSLHVLCVSHAAFPWNDMTMVDTLWSKSSVPTMYSDANILADPTRTNIAAASAVKDFIDDGGKFICWLTGHQHGDDVHKLASYGNQFVVTLASFVQRASMLQKNTSEATYNYDCLTYITVDTKNEVVRFLRIGADIDMYGVKHNGLSIKYSTPDVIASW